jgi:hypothetical protein
MDMLFVDQNTGSARGSHSRSTLTDMALSLVARAAGCAGLASALSTWHLASQNLAPTLPRGNNLYFERTSSSLDFGYSGPGTWAPEAIHCR